MYLCSDYDINVNIGYYYLLELEEDILAIKQNLYEQWMKGINSKSTLKSKAMDLRVILIKAIWVFYHV